MRGRVTQNGPPLLSPASGGTGPCARLSRLWVDLYLSGCRVGEGHPTAYLSAIGFPSSRDLVRLAWPGCGRFYGGCPCLCSARLRETTLTEMPWSEKAIDTVEKQMKFSRRRYRTAVCFAVAALLLTIFLGVWYFGVEHPLILVKGPSKVFVGTFLAVYICYSLLVVYAFLSVPEYRAFKALIRSVDFFDRAMRAKPAAGARRRLAAQISVCIQNSGVRCADALEVG